MFTNHQLVILCSWVELYLFLITYVSIHGEKDYMYYAVSVSENIHLRVYIVDFLFRNISIVKTKNSVYCIA